jgi:hypothetical protein
MLGRLWILVAVAPLLIFGALFELTDVPKGEPLAVTEGEMPGYHYAIDPPLTSYSDPRITREVGEPALVFAARATRAVHFATYHCMTDEGWPSGAIKAEAAQPGLFSEIGVLSLAHFTCGLCGQRAFIVADALDRAGIPAKVVGLVGHVVTLFSHDGHDYVTDPDLGVMPFQAPFLFSNPRRRRIDRGKAHRQLLRENVTKAYAYVRTLYGTDFFNMVVGFYLSTDDTVEYYTMEHLRAVAERQAAVLETPRNLVNR